jgi:hypothetical protein
MMPAPLFKRVVIHGRKMWQRIVAQPAVNKWLAGNVVPIRSVPAKLRPIYRDTLYRAARAAKAYGHAVHVNSSYRDPAEQAKLYAQNMLNGHPRPGHALTARPGTSPHERGIGLDIPNARSTPKLIAALRAEQLIDDVPSEIWHVTNHYWLAKGA